MKKLMLVALALAVVAGFAFAETSAQVDYAISGSATTTLGYDLDGGVFGIKNETSSDLTITFVDGSEEKAGEGAVAGWISLSGFSAKAGANLGKEEVYGYNSDGDQKDRVQDGSGNDASSYTDFVVTPPSVTAKIMMGPAYILITNADDSVGAASLDPSYIKEEAFGGADVAIVSADDSGYATIALGVDTEVFDALIIYGTEKDWNDATQPRLGLIGLNAFVGVDAFSLNAKLQAKYGANGESFATAGNPLTAGVDVSYGIGFGDNNVTPKVAYDVKVEGNTTDQEVGFGVSASIAAISMGVDGLYVIPGATGADSKLLVKANITEATGDDGALPVVGLALNFEYGMMGDDSALAGDFTFDAALGVASPYVGVIYEQDLGTVDQDENDFMLKVGTTLNVIDMVTFELAYKSGDLLQDADPTDPSVDLYTNDSAGKLGEITFATTISY